MYCPSQFQQLQCPEGSYCPSGSLQPTKCEGLSSCPAGSQNPRFYGGILLCVLIDFLIIAYVFYVKAQESKRDGKPISTLLPASLQKRLSKRKPSGEKSIALLKDSSGSMSGLENGFKKGLNGEKVSMNFVFDKMKLQIAGGLNILSDVSGSILGGRMIAIMGPSGAGSNSNSDPYLTNRNDVYECSHGKGSEDWR